MTQRLLVAGGTEATRYSSPGCYAEPGDSRANVEEDTVEPLEFVGIQKVAVEI